YPSGKTINSSGTASLGRPAAERTSALARPAAPGAAPGLVPRRPSESIVLPGRSLQRPPARRWSVGRVGSEAGAVERLDPALARSEAARALRVPRPDQVVEAVTRWRVRAAVVPARGAQIAGQT